jgi:hypothetical protein
MQNKNKNTTWYNKKEEEKYELTCLAIPKSASLTIPDESTSKLAPLMSLWTQEKKNPEIISSVISTSTLKR